MLRARVIITMKCNRSCEGCCNTNERIRSLMTPLHSLKELEKYDEVILTGGEPMLNPDRTLKIINTLLGQNIPNRKIYLYTALWHPALKGISRLIDGIHFTLHNPLKENDLFNFNCFQDLATPTSFKKCSFRCYIDPNVTEEITIRPYAWERLEIKPWIDSGDCPMSEDVLFVLDEGELK